MDDQRRARFVAWFKATYKDRPSARTDFIAETGKHGYTAYSKGRVNHFFDSNQPFGETAARNLALHLGLAENCFLIDQDSRPTPARPWPFRRISQKEWDACEEWQRNVIEDAAVVKLRELRIESAVGNS